MINKQKTVRILCKFNQTDRTVQILQQFVNITHISDFKKQQKSKMCKLDRSKKFH